MNVPRLFFVWFRAFVVPLSPRRAFHPSTQGFSQKTAFEESTPPLLLTRIFPFFFLGGGPADEPAQPGFSFLCLPGKWTDYYTSRR